MIYPYVFCLHPCGILLLLLLLFCMLACDVCNIKNHRQTPESLYINRELTPPRRAVFEALC